MFLSVCLIAPSESQGLKLTAHSGGSSLIALKNENGGRLATPRSLTVEIQAIGRGITSSVDSL